MITQIVNGNYIKIAKLEVYLDELFGKGNYTMQKAVSEKFELEVPYQLTEDQIKELQKMSYPKKGQTII